MREIQEELDKIIQTGIKDIVQLVKNQERVNAGNLDNENDFTRKTRSHRNDKRRQEERVLNLGLQKLQIVEKEFIKKDKVRIFLSLCLNLTIHENLFIFFHSQTFISICTIFWYINFVVRTTFSTLQQFIISILIRSRF